jgi:hypothetical protein
MNMIPLKKQRAAAPAAPVSGPQVLAALDRRLAELDAREALLLEQQIILEQSSAASASPEAEADAAQAQQVLDGADVVVRRERPLSRLEAIRAERKLIQLALKIGSSEKHRLLEQRAAEIWAARFSEIAAMERRRVQLALDLQRLNRAREKLRDDLVRAGGAGYFPTDGAALLELGDRDDEVQWAAARLICDGVASPAEVEEWKAGHG